MQPMLHWSALQLMGPSQASVPHASMQLVPAQVISPWQAFVALQSMSQLAAWLQSIELHVSSQMTLQAKPGGQTTAPGQVSEVQSIRHVLPAHTPGAGQVVVLHSTGAPASGRGPASGVGGPASGTSPASNGGPASGPASRIAASMLTPASSGASPSP